MGPHITGMLFALHTPDSKFCKDQMTIICSQDNNKIYRCVWKTPETVLLSFN